MKSNHVHQSGVPRITRGREETIVIGPTVSEQRAQRLGEALGAERYLECSAQQDINSAYRLYDVLATTSRNYVDALDSEQHRWSKPVWKGSFSMPVIHNSERTIDSTTGTSSSVLTVKQHLNRMLQRP